VFSGLGFKFRVWGSRLRWTMVVTEGVLYRILKIKIKKNSGPSWQQKMFSIDFFSIECEAQVAATWLASRRARLVRFRL
jgi:hypothetical protein